MKSHPEHIAAAVVRNEISADAGFTIEPTAPSSSAGIVLNRPSRRAGSGERVSRRT